MIHLVPDLWLGLHLEHHLAEDLLLVTHLARHLVHRLGFDLA